MGKKNNRFIKIYDTFSSTEKKEFLEFTSIPFLNKGRNYNQFIENLDSDRDDILNSGTDRSNKNKTYSNRISELTILAEKFLMLKNLEKDNFTFETLLLDELCLRNLNHFYQQRYTVLKKKIMQKKPALIR